MHLRPGSGFCVEAACEWSTFSYKFFIQWFWRPAFITRGGKPRRASGTTVMMCNTRIHFVVLKFFLRLKALHAA